MIRYLLDTNVISEVRKTRPHGAVTSWLETLQVEQIFISAVTIGELQTGVELTRKRDPDKAAEIESWLIAVEMSYVFVPMDTACFREWARMVNGRSADLHVDGMIAATARVHGFIRATKRISSLWGSAY
ncbi:MAG: type II toxin-antitoxin system VapC family toxin [Candidatus Sulfotelmatobacter sp.]